MHSFTKRCMSAEEATQVFAAISVDPQHAMVELVCDGVTVEHKNYRLGQEVVYRSEVQLEEEDEPDRIALPESLVQHNGQTCKVCRAPVTPVEVLNNDGMCNTCDAAYHC